MKLPYSTSIRRPHERTLAIEAGQVVCQRRGIVDIEDCWTCPSYRGLSSGHIEGLICGAEGFALPRAVRSLVGPFGDEAAER